MAASSLTTPGSPLHRPVLCSQVRFLLAPPSPVRSEPPPAAASSSEKPEAPQDLGAPVQQSSLALSLELQAARAAAGGQFDAAKAVEEQLRKSFQTRCGLEESVTEGEGGRRPAGRGSGGARRRSPPPLMRSQG